MEKSNKKSGGMLLIFICWIVYTCAYLGKYSYSSNTIKVITHYGVTKADAGLISTVFFIAYGIGQVVNGICCKFYPKKYIIGGALVVSAAINAVLYFDVPFWSIKYLWLVNGVAQSVLWPTLILTLGAYLSQAKLKSAILAMATTVAVGTAVAYALSALFVQFFNFKYSFITTAIVLIVAATAWLTLYNRAVASAQKESEEQTENAGQTAGSVKGALTGGMIVMLLFLALFAVVNNLVKDGLNTWVPSILYEVYALDDSLSILLTITLSIVGIFGSVTAVALHKKIKNFLLLAGVLFATSSVCIFAVILLFKTDFWLGIILLFGLISLLMHGINNVVTSMAPLYLRSKLNSGMLSGLLNGACYIGSAISAYGLGAYADRFGWTSTFYLLLGCCAVPIVISLIMAAVMHRAHKTK
ncbi:MAG: MFS transporter [Clostridia bacterium]|nr:MFS transporter [Clostridia bacterium]